MSRVLTIFISAIFIMLSGVGYYKFCGSDLANYLPFLLHAHDPALYANDLLIGTLDYHPVLIWKSLAVFLGLMNPETLIRVCFIFQTAVIAGGALFLFYTLFRNYTGIPFLLLLLVLPASTAGFGRYGLNPYGYFQPGAMSIGLACFAFGLLIRKRWALAGIMSGLIFLLHPISGVFTVLVFAAAAGAELIRVKGEKGRLFNIMIGFLLIFIVASPSIFQELSVLFGKAASAAPHIDKAQWRSLAEWRLNHGGFISKWNPDRFIQLLLVAGSILLFRSHPAFLKIIPVLIGVLCSFLLACLADFADITLLIRLQQGRMMFYVYLVLCLFLADFWTKILSPQDPLKRPALLPQIALITGSFLLCFNSGFGNYPTWLKASILLCLFASVLLCFLRGRTSQKNGFIILIFLAVAVSTVAINRLVVNAKTASCTECEDANWQEVQTWCLQNTPKSAVIVSPIYREGFRCYSQRAIYADYKDGGPHLFCDATLGAWRTRLTEFGVDTIPMNRALLPALYHHSAIDVAKRHGLRFVVMEKKLRSDTRGTVVFENNHYCVVVVD